ncbi:MAG: hypothetical protein LUG16_07400 [Candidatus Gastranaerophilales bacterium]|nr:hypothetical protein [Candidatus Gastranaerophilales bacterium]
MNMQSKVLKSNKILGLEYMKQMGFRVPEFDFIPAYQELSLRDSDIDINYPPSVLKKIIEEKIKKFDLSNGVSVRSASFDEDNSNQSSAGRYLSFNGLSNTDEIIKSALIIWLHHRKNSNNVKCPLILQETHASFYSGVAFKDGENIVIESYFGACSNIVNGNIKPYMTVINNNITTHKFSSQCNYNYIYSVHKNIFKNKTFFIGGVLYPKSDFYITNNRLYGTENSKMLNVYGNRASRPIMDYEEKIVPQIIEILEKLDNKDGVDIEWGSDINANIYMYQFRKLTRKIVNLNICSKEDVSDVNEIIGIPTSPGIAEGIITTDITKLNENSILYIKNDNVEDVNLLKNIKGVISVNGGILSHLSIICRELNIPCVVGIEKPITVNCLAEINGSTGIIKILN